VIRYNPLAGGFLTGKHARTEPPPDGGRFALGRAGSMYQERYWHDREFDTVEELRGLAADAGLSLTTMAVSWVLAHPAITSAIVGASRPEQLADSIAAADKALAPELKDQLDALTHEYRYGDAAR
jgi:aryl-alcohol dehydrogenase-like predicted oxidoreductase